MLRKLLAFFVCFCIMSCPAYSVVVDDFVEKTLDKNIQPKKIHFEIIKDSFAESNKNKNQYTKTKVDFAEQIVTTTRIPVAKKAVIIKEENAIPVKIRIKKYLSTKQNIDEGEYLDFETVSEVKIKDKIYPAGTLVKGRIETISQNKIWGVPADLVVGNFSLEDKTLSGEISKIGANRSLWVYPAVYLLLFPFGEGLLLIPIRGGHAKIKPHQTYTVYYQ